MKKFSKYVLICILSLSSITTSIYAKNALTTPQITICNDELSQKYDEVYDQMLQELNQKVRTNSIPLSTNETSTQIYTKSLQEENSIVTLGIVYSLEPATYSSDFQGTTDTITHAKVYVRSDIDKSVDSQGFDIATLTSVEGKVVALYDGAKLTKINVHAFQNTLLGSSGIKSTNFETPQLSYSKSFSWPYVRYSDSMTLLGQQVNFTFQRGTSTVSDSINVTFGGGPL